MKDISRHGSNQNDVAWHDVHTIVEAPRVRQKSSGRIAAEEEGHRAKIEALKAQRLARDAAEAAADAVKVPERRRAVRAKAG